MMMRSWARRIFSRPSSGHSLMELSVSVMLLGFLLFAAFRTRDAFTNALYTVKDNNISLFVLESRKNWFLAEKTAGKAPDLMKTVTPYGEFELPSGISLETVKGVEAGKGTFWKLKLGVPSRKGANPHVYIRELLDAK